MSDRLFKPNYDTWITTPKVKEIVPIRKNTSTESISKLRAENESKIAESADSTFTLKIDNLPQLSEKTSLDDIPLLSKEDTYREPSQNKKFSSRFYENFEEISSLGKGASGEVVKVRYRYHISLISRNKLDGRYYAVKKIVIRQGHKLTRIMREVQTLSRLHHQNILRYYQAWIEEAPEAKVREI